MYAWAMWERSLIDAGSDIIRELMASPEMNDIGLIQAHVLEIAAHGEAGAAALGLRARAMSMYVSGSDFDSAKRLADQVLGE